MQNIIIFILLLVFTACSSNSSNSAGSSSPSNDIGAPVFSINANVSVSENQTSAITLVATDDSNILQEKNG